MMTREMQMAAFIRSFSRITRKTKICRKNLNNRSKAKLNSMKKRHLRPEKRFNKNHYPKDNQTIARSLKYMKKNRKSIFCLSLKLPSRTSRMRLLLALR